jgi:tellurium resistance protein TerD
MRRGANVALTRENPGLKHAVVGVRWGAGTERGLAANLELAAILCDESGRARTANDFVYFNQIVSEDLSVAQIEQVMGADAEQLDIDLSAVPEQIGRIVIVAYVNEGSPKRRTLGQLKECVVRVLDGADGRPLAESENLAAVLGPETAVVLGEIYRYRKEWKFKVVGQGYAAGLVGVAELYGLPL